MDNHLFSGLKVIDAATVIAAPAAAMMLGDFGADVIKVEQPDGDMLRLLSHLPGTPNAGNHWFWQMDGRNKRSIVLDLKTEGGMEVLRRLVAECDVFITNQPHSVRESLKTRYEDFKPLNPNMIYASLTAYGEEGPERARKGFDQLAYWARSGLMDLMREPGTMPTQGLPGMGDHPTGVAIYAGIVTALLHRERTGEGGMVHTSLLANGLWSVAGIAGGVMAGGDMQAYREASNRNGGMGRVYQASDGRWLQFNMVRNDHLRDLMFTAMEATHILADERFATPQLMWQNREAFGEEIAAIIATRASDEWLETFATYDVPVNRIALVEETATDPQILENRMAVVPDDPEVEVPLVLNHPVKATSVAQVGPRRAPSLGEHTEEILRELGYTDEARADLAAAGAVIIGERQ